MIHKKTRPWWYGVVTHTKIEEKFAKKSPVKGRLSWDTTI